MSNFSSGVTFINQSELTKNKMAEEQISHDSLTKFELARVVGSRALQISHGAPAMIKLDKETLMQTKYNPIEIAKLELKAGVIPITVVRPIPKEH